MSTADEFGKDLGLMHELVITGRRVGLDRDDWVKLAHNEPLLRGVRNLVSRSENEGCLPETAFDDEKVKKLVNLFKLTLPFLGPDRWCTACGINHGRGRENGTRLLEGYQEIGLVISEHLTRCLRGGDCHQPIFDVLLPNIKEAIGLESPSKSATSIVILPNNNSLTLRLLATSVTSFRLIILLKEGLDEMLRNHYSMAISIQLVFEKDKEKK